jgi:hypothetical protein
MWQKNGQKRSYNSYKRATFISEHSLSFKKMMLEKGLQKQKNIQVGFHLESEQQTNWKESCHEKKNFVNIPLALCYHVGIK